MTNTDDLRVAFEAWISSPPYERMVHRFPQAANAAWPRQYKDIAVQLAWESWQQAFAVYRGTEKL